jgi:hypothetical protein
MRVLIEISQVITSIGLVVSGVCWSLGMNKNYLSILTAIFLFILLTGRLALYFELKPFEGLFLLVASFGFVGIGIFIQAQRERGR